MQSSTGTISAGKNGRHAWLWTIAAAAILSGMGWLWWVCGQSEKIHFLSPHAGADWVVASDPIQATRYRSYPRCAVFQREFSLGQKPATADLNVRAFTASQIAVNGEHVDLPAVKNWKDAAETQVASLLRPGTNLITVWVTNTMGPPALWLRLETSEIKVGTDRQWRTLASGEWLKVQLASDPPKLGPEHPLVHAAGTLHVDRHIWVADLLVGAASVALLVLVRKWIGNRSGGLRSEFWIERFSNGVLALVLIVRAALLMNNLPQLPQEVGFDAEGHQDYIRFVQQKHAFPLADQGWEMYQPPLYYASTALLLSTTGVSLPDSAAVLTARAVNGAVGLAHCFLAFLCLRLFFPANVPAQTAGLFIAAFVPPHIYLSQYVTNGPLSALLVTAGLYLSLRAIQSEKISPGICIGTGLILGAAMLTKMSALIALPFLFAAPAMRLLTRRNSAVDVRHIICVLLSCAVVCGWYYGLVWTRFGNPFAANWDVGVSGEAWWQYPGYRTTAYYSSFGQSFHQPLFSSLYSFWDGMYTTVWGDGLVSGTAQLSTRPPWNYEWMNAGYVLAIAPSILFFIGLGLVLFRSLTRKSPEWLLSACLVLSFGFAILYMSLRIPSYAQVKAFYGLPASVPFAALVAAGWDYVRRRHSVIDYALWGLIAAWAFNSSASFWIRRENPQTHMLWGTYQAARQDYSSAVKSFSTAAALAPRDARAQHAWGWALLSSGNLDAAAPHLTEALKLDPSFAEARYNLGELRLSQGRAEDAITEFRRALALKPDWPALLNNLAWLLATDPRENVRNGPEAVRFAERAYSQTQGTNASILDTLAAAYAEAKRFQNAIDIEQKVYEEAARSGDPKQMDKAKRRLELYRSGQPFRQN